MSDERDAVDAEAASYRQALAQVTATSPQYMKVFLGDPVASGVLRCMHASGYNAALRYGLNQQSESLKAMLGLDGGVLGDE